MKSRALRQSAHHVRDRRPARLAVGQSPKQDTCYDESPLYVDDSDFFEVEAISLAEAIPNTTSLGSIVMRLSWEDTFGWL